MSQRRRWMETRRLARRKGGRRIKVAPCNSVDLASKQLVKGDVHELEVENAPDGSGRQDYTSGGTSAQMSRDQDNSERCL